MRCVLIYNPAAGGGGASRAGAVDRVARVLEELGAAVQVVATEAAGSAGWLARAAAEGGADAVFACGGDGTVHEVAQGLVSETGEGKTALGIVPLGSANALARHIGLSLDPEKAARQQAGGISRTISLGRVEYGLERRYFLAMAGAGPDGALAYEVQAGHKSGLGRFAYYAHAARLFAARRFRPFEVEYVEDGSGRTVRERAVCAMAVRVKSLGGLFGRLTGREELIPVESIPGESMEEGKLRLIFVRPPSWIALPMWFVSGWLGWLRINPLVRQVTVREFSLRTEMLRSEMQSAPHIEADGEWLGRLPMRVSVVGNGLRILVPQPVASSPQKEL